MEQTQAGESYIVNKTAAQNSPEHLQRRKQGHRSNCSTFPQTHPPSPLTWDWIHPEEPRVNILLPAGPPGDLTEGCLFAVGGGRDANRGGSLLPAEGQEVRRPTVINNRARLLRAARWIPAPPWPTGPD